MIKYIVVGMLAYMIYASALDVKFTEAEVGIGFNPGKVVTRVVSDFETFVESVKKEIL